MCQWTLHSLPSLSNLRPVYGVFKAALSPSSALDSIPNQIATFNVDVYNQGIVQMVGCGSGVHVVWRIRVYVVCRGVCVHACVETGGER